ncbi:hypothetical protein SteCoe_21011 [Stentor coeruleus]|uniref:Uncharacterized protein n=1 Tax=Stentor coeruleus TaxID=5963 RepID=A0A1R2BQP6_9CILI|nr:hypothetical protein SteCoe_21011 [Stentor coeruleus]
MHTIMRVKKEVFWNSEELKNNQDYEYLKAEYEAYKLSGAKNKVQEFLLKNLELLIQQVLANNDTKMQIKLLEQTRRWYDTHKKPTVFRSPSTKTRLLEEKNLFTRRKQRRNYTKQVKNYKELPPCTSSIFEHKFLKFTDKSLRQWSLEKSRSSEDFLYKYESRYSRTPKISNQSQKHDYFTAHLKQTYKKHKILINPLHFSFAYEDPFETKAPKIQEIKIPDFKEVDTIKKKLASKQIIVSSKTIELGLIIENTPSIVKLPVGGELLLKSKNI